MKGVVVQGFKQYIGEHVPGGVEAVASRIREPATAGYVRQTFLVATWYDMLPLLHVYPAAAALLGVPTVRFVADYSAWQAERDVRGIYRLLLMLASPELVASRLGVAYSRYFDFGKVEVLSVVPGAVETMVHGMPAMLVPWYKVAVFAAAEKILALAGARHIAATYSRMEPAGVRGDVPCVSFTVRRTWAR